MRNKPGAIGRKHRGTIGAPQRFGNSVSKSTQVTGKRIGGALRAEFARAQKRRDNRR